MKDPTPQEKEQVIEVLMTIRRFLQIKDEAKAREAAEKIFESIVKWVRES